MRDILPETVNISNFAHAGCATLSVCLRGWLDLTVDFSDNTGNNHMMS